MSADRKLVRAEHNSGVIWKSARWLQMASGAVLFLLTIEAAVAADQSASGESITQSSALVLDGKVKHPQRLSVERPAQTSGRTGGGIFSDGAWDRKVELHWRAALDAARRGRRN